MRYSNISMTNPPKKPGHALDASAEQIFELRSAFKFTFIRTRIATAERMGDPL